MFGYSQSHGNFLHPNFAAARSGVTTTGPATLANSNNNTAAALQILHLPHETQTLLAQLLVPRQQQQQQTTPEQTVREQLQELLAQQHQSQQHHQQQQFWPTPAQQPTVRLLEASLMDTSQQTRTRTMPPEQLLEAAYDHLYRQRLSDGIFTAPTGHEVLQLARDLNDRLLELETRQALSVNNIPHRTASHNEIAKYASHIDVVPKKVSNDVKPAAQQGEEQPEATQKKRKARTSAPKIALESKTTNVTVAKKQDPPKKKRKSNTTSTTATSSITSDTNKVPQKSKKLKEKTHKLSATSSKKPELKEEIRKPTNEIPASITETSTNPSDVYSQESAKSLDADPAKPKKQSKATKQREFATRESKRKSKATVPTAGKKASTVAPKQSKAETTKRAGRKSSPSAAEVVSRAILTRRDSRGKSIMEIVLGKLPSLVRPQHVEDIRSTQEKAIGVTDKSSTQEKPQEEATKADAPEGIKHSRGCWRICDRTKCTESLVV